MMRLLRCSGAAEREFSVDILSYVSVIIRELEAEAAKLSINHASETSLHWHEVKAPLTPAASASL